MPTGTAFRRACPTSPQWLRGLKSGGCTACHGLGNKATREIPPQLGEFDSLVAAWDRRIQSGQAGGSMSGALDRMGRRRALEMYADWTGRIMAGEVPPVPPRPQGVERNVVVTQWDWADPTAYLHDEASTDKRNPTVNANGPIYGALEASADYVPVLDPASNSIREVVVPVRDPDTPLAAGAPLASSPYWGDEAIWDSRSNVHNPMLDQDGRVWLTSRVRGPENPPMCLEGSDHPSARVFPNARANRHLAVYDPATDEMTLVGTCYSTHHLIFAEDENDTLWTSGGGQVVGWLNTKLFLETGDEEAAQGWSPLVLDTNGNGVRDEWVEPGEPADPAKDTRIRSGFYGVAYNPVDGSIWGSSLGMPGAVLRFAPGDNPSETGLTEFYEVPFQNPGAEVQDGYSPRGMDVDRNGVVWTPLASGHLASFDRGKCTGPLNGPDATGQHCPEGWTLYEEPMPQMKGIAESGSIEGSYYTWVDQFDTLGAGPRRAHQHRQRGRGAARAARRRVGRPARAVSAGVLHQVDGRPHRRPRRGMEGQGHLGDLEHPGPVPRRDRGGHPEQGGAVPAPSRPAGEVDPALCATNRVDAARHLHPPGPALPRRVPLSLVAVAQASTRIRPLPSSSGRRPPALGGDDRGPDSRLVRRAPRRSRCAAGSSPQAATHRNSAARTRPVALQARPRFQEVEVPIGGEDPEIPQQAEASDQEVVPGQGDAVVPQPP